MWFNSFAFWLFLGVVLVVYRFLGHRERNRFLLLASYFFYGCWDWRFLSLIFFTTAFDFFAARRIAGSDDPRTRKRWMLASLFVDLSILGVFKYFNFFVGEFNRLLESVGLDSWQPGFSVILPVGISFYTFQALSYTIDVYRRRTKPVNDFFDFALYISLFPQLVAGPIERSENLLPQVRKRRPPCDAERFREGLYHVLSGLFKKVVVADNMAWLANHVFSQPPGQLQAVDVLVGVYAFAFQIYGDFSGYSSIAIGGAKWLGFDLMENFRQPYFARNPQDFWRRWHISLSTWLRDYLYISLGGNRRGKWMTYRNLLLTMVLGGLWHGAAWTFVIWGTIHGGWLVLHRLIFGRDGTSGSSRRWSSLRSLLAILGTFHLVCLTWLFFRADSVEQATAMLRALVGPWQLTPFAQTALVLIAIFAGPWGLFEAWLERRKDTLALLRPEVGWGWRSAVYLYIIAMMMFFPPPVASEFIYFQF